MTRTRSSAGIQRHGLIVATPPYPPGIHLDTAEVGREQNGSASVSTASHAPSRHGTHPAPQVARDVTMTDTMGEWCPIHTEVLTARVWYC